MKRLLPDLLRPPTALAVVKPLPRTEPRAENLEAIFTSPSKVQDLVKSWRMQAARLKAQATMKQSQHEAVSRGPHGSFGYIPTDVQTLLDQANVYEIVAQELESL